MKAFKIGATLGALAFGIFIGAYLVEAQRKYSR